MTSPYIEREAQRLGITERSIDPMYGELVTPAAVSSHADHQPEHVRFIRQRPSHRWGELEKTKPLRPWIKDAINGLGLIAFMIASFYAMDAVAKFCEFMGWCA